MSVKMDYEVSFLSTGKIKIQLNNKADSLEKMKIKEKQMKGLRQLCTYGLEFIRYLSYENKEQSTTVYLVEPAVLRLAQRVLGRSTVLDQLLDYDCRKVDNYYLSTLTILNIELEEAPVFPIAFLVHENNDKRSHLNFWTNFVLPNLNYPVPISVSEEPCILKAVLKCLQDSPGSKLFFCSNKIVANANRFYQNCLNASQPIKYKMDDIDYKEENFFIGIENLVGCETPSKFKETLKEFRDAWSADYLRYFCDKISPLILNNLERARKTNLRMNAPEQKKYDLDSVLANQNKFCLTDLIMRLYRQSCELVIQFNRFYRSNSKPYKVKYKFISCLKSMPIECKFIEYLDESKQKNHTSCLTLFTNPKPSIYNLFHFQIADLVINNGLIYLDLATNSYMVRSPFNETVRRVYGDQGKTRCTCSLQELCFHKIAAKFVSESQL